MKELRWLADYVVEFSDMSEDAKEIAFDFINEADEAQLKILLMDARLSLNYDEKLVESKFNQSEVKTLLEKDPVDVRVHPPYKSSGRKTAMSVLGLVGGPPFGPVNWVVYRTIRAAFDECTEQCGTYKINNAKRQICMQKCKEERDKKLAKLKAKMKK